MVSKATKGENGDSQAVTAATKSHESGHTVGTPTFARYSVRHVRKDSAIVRSVAIGTPSLSHFGR